MTALTNTDNANSSPVLSFEHSKFKLVDLIDQALASMDRPFYLHRYCNSPILFLSSSSLLHYSAFIFTLAFRLASRFILRHSFQYFLIPPILDLLYSYTHFFITFQHLTHFDHSFYFSPSTILYLSAILTLVATKQGSNTLNSAQPLQTHKSSSLSIHSFCISQSSKIYSIHNF